MITIFFTVLIAILALSFSIYSFFYERESLLTILLLTLFSFLCIAYWPISLLTLIPLILHRKLKFGQFIAANMFSSVVLGWFFLNFFAINLPFYFQIAFLSLVTMCLLSMFGIFERRIRKYLLISNAIQVLFIIVDLVIARMLGEFGILNLVQVFNYTFAGSALFLTIGIFARNKKYLYELEGSYFANRWNDIFATIACLSLAGLPIFNMFVSEWMFFTKSFILHPSITILGVFTALLLFVMYYKVIYFLLTGEGRYKGIPKAVTLMNGVFAFLCVLFGMIPQVQIRILEALI
jgi:formate hydrogenlyase subunit 3/multisubunit Na+/H+ antiporter MnhD subunit